VPLLKAGQIEIVAAVEGFDGPSVLLADGTRIEPEAVIAATGYRRGLEPLVGHLGVLGEDGIPLVSGGKQHPSAPGLFFTGYRPDLSGHLRPMRHEARAIAKAARNPVGEFQQFEGALRVGLPERLHPQVKPRKLWRHHRNRHRVQRALEDGGDVCSRQTSTSDSIARANPAALLAAPSRRPSASPEDRITLARDGNAQA
jgi:hypothetical protein